jgi:hypothetical protein
MIMQGISPLRRRQRSFPLAPLGTLSHSGDNQKFLIGGGSILFGKVSDFPCKAELPFVFAGQHSPELGKRCKDQKKRWTKNKKTREKRLT